MAMQTLLASATAAIASTLRVGVTIGLYVAVLGAMMSISARVNDCYGRDSTLRVRCMRHRLHFN